LPPGSRPGARGFTLLEMMAVVAILALLFGLALPNLGVLGGANLRSQARELAGAIELARQRAVVTGTPHRVLLALEEGAFRVEWWRSEQEEAEQREGAAGGGLPAGPVDVASLDLRGDTPIPLEPPRAEERSYRPIPQRQFGRDRWLGDGVFFAGVETPEGWVERGEVELVFERDGSTDPALVLLIAEDGREMALEVRPLLDVVRIGPPEERRRG